VIGYYVHHVGAGHGQRALAIASKIRQPVVAFSSMSPPTGWKGEWIHLPSDTGKLDVSNADVTANDTLHWVPLRHEGLRRRMGIIGSHLASGSIDAIVVDVSVEVSVLARLYGVPVIVMAMPGERHDRAHQLCYDLAEVLLAPWPGTSYSSWPKHWTDKATYLGGLSRFDGRPAPERHRGRKVLVLSGVGSLDTKIEEICAAAAATPDWEWEILGSESTAASAHPSNLKVSGWIEDVWSKLLAADVIVTHAGQNSIAEVAAARRPAIVIPQRRPFGEQHATTAQLSQVEVAKVSQEWPTPSEWPGLLSLAEEDDGHKWSRWSFGDAGERAAAIIETIAARRGEPLEISQTLVPHQATLGR
jgi:predicted glycosyltransferase